LVKLGLSGDDVPDGIPAEGNPVCGKLTPLDGLDVIGIDELGVIVDVGGVRGTGVGNVDPFGHPSPSRFC
jgi:hypothetical protein